MLPSADKLYGDALWRCFMDFSTCPHWQHHFQVVFWPWYYCAWLACHHAWPEPHLESMGYLQEKDEIRSIQQSRRAEDSIVPHQSHRLIVSITDAGACVHKLTYFQELELFCFANPFLNKLQEKKWTFWLYSNFMRCTWLLFNAKNIYFGP